MNPSGLSICDFCGNNVTKNQIEFCDDGTLDGEGCDSECQGYAIGWTCTLVGESGATC